MKKVFFIILILITFNWIVDANRDLIRSATSVFQTMGEELKTRNQMEEIGGIVQDYWRQQGTLPVGDVRRVVAAYRQSRDLRVTGATGTDVWGTGYRIRPADEIRQGFYVISAGPDKQWNTRDDLKLFQAIEAVLRRGTQGTIQNRPLNRKGEGP